MTNIIHCLDCHRFYIHEEYPNHECEKISMEFIDEYGSIWGTYDGVNWFQLPSFKSDQPRVNTDNSQPNSYQNLIKGSVNLTAHFSTRQPEAHDVVLFTSFLNSMAAFFKVSKSTGGYFLTSPLSSKSVLNISNLVCQSASMPVSNADF